MILTYSYYSGNIYNSYYGLLGKEGGLNMDITINVVEAKNKFSELLGKVAYGKGRFIVERKGKPMVAVVSMEDLKKLEEMEDELDTRLLKAAVSNSKGSIPLEKVIEEYEKKHSLN